MNHDVCRTFPRNGDYISELPAQDSISDGLGLTGTECLQQPDPHRGIEPPTAASPCRQWFALALRSRAAFAVRDQLRMLWIREFLPVYTEESRWTDRIAVVTRPLFPGYIFALFDANSDERIEVLRTRGVASILSLDGQPAAIPDAAIADLRRMTRSPKAVRPGPYVAGSTVIVARGPFAGITGIVTRVRGNTTLSVPVAIMGRSVAVEIDAADVEPAKAPV